MKFGQLIEYNMRNALFKNHAQCGMKRNGLKLVSLPHF